MITQEELKKELKYFEDSGVFLRLKSGGGQKKFSIAGSRHKSGYWKITINKKVYSAHRLVWLYVYGYMPNEIDHINHNREDNRLINIREVNHLENTQNQTLYKNNTSGQAGVSWCNTSNRWVSRINVDGKRKCLGYFIDYSDAVNARKNAEILYGYHKEHGKDNEGVSYE